MPTELFIFAIAILIITIMIKSLIEIFGSDMTTIHRNFVKSLVVVFPLSFVLLDVYCTSFHSLDFAAQCIYSVALSIMEVAANVIGAAILVKRHRFFSSTSLYVSICPSSGTFLTFLSGHLLMSIQDISIEVLLLFAILFNFFFCFSFVIFIAPFFKYYHKKYGIKHKDEERNKETQQS